jgi:hypothetical protein
MTGGDMRTPPLAPALVKAELPKQSFRARLGAKFKSMLEWMRERLSLLLRQ